MIGTVEVPSVVKIPSERPRSPGQDTNDQPRARCPYCLEPFSPEMLETQLKRACPLCRHQIPPSLLGIPVHLLNRPQRWDLLANEMDYIWNWEYELFLKVRQKEFSSFTEFQYEKEDFEALCDGLHAAREQKELFLREPGDMEDLLAQFLKYREDSAWRLPQDLEGGRKWREMAQDLSAEGAGFQEITWFQIQLIRSTSWGAFGREGAAVKEAVLKMLEQRK